MLPSHPIGRRESPGRIRLVVADTPALDRAGLVAVLATDASFEVVAVAETVAVALERCRALRPDVLVLALDLHGQEDGAALSTIRSALPALRILALAARSAARCLVLDPPWRKALRGVPAGAPPAGTDCLVLAAHQGAMATLRRTSTPGELFAALRLVAQGQACYDPQTAQRVLAEARPGETPPPLSARERQVASLLVEGHSNKEIATLLAIEEATVKKHIRHILEKLGVQDRLQAGLFLARHPLALVDPAGP